MTGTVLALAGVVAAALAATSVARDDAGKSRKALERSSADIASTLQLAIQHENDLVVNAGAHVLDNPGGSQTQFRRWTTSVQALSRYPELEGIGVVTVIPAAGLAAYAARAASDPAGPLGADGTLGLTPPGARPFYCLTALALSRTLALSTPAGLDLCAGASGATLLAARDSGLGTYEPYAFGPGTWLGIQTPIYTGGAVPATKAARAAAFVGWVGILIDPNVLLARSIQGYPDNSVSMRYRVDATDVAFSSGRAPAHAQSVSTDLGDGWTISTAGAVVGASVFDDATAVQLLITGMVLSVLLGFLVFVLGTGRERARRLVEHRTTQLHHLALHDALTDLPNRALVIDRIGQMLARNRRRGTTGMAMFMDLDDFKDVNDTLGHQSGDALLIAVAARLAGALRDADTIGRMGGDEFVVLIETAAELAGPEPVAQRLLDVMSQPFHLENVATPVHVGISIGIATGDRADPAELLRDADVALYEAKAAGKNRYATFDPQMQSSLNRRVALDVDLRSALAGGQFRLVYQPIYALADLTVTGVEALLRWDHPSRGTMLPDEFVPFLEQSGQIRAVGRWVLHEACQQMATWHARGDTLDVSVNVSARQLEDDSIIADVYDALNASTLNANSLIIEVAETALMANTDDAARRLQSIRALGVRVAVDDFGTGYSSLAYLRRFPVDCIKIDRSFTHAITSSPESTALIKTLIQLGKDLGLQTLAEGVETVDEMDLLRTVHVDQAQGFLMAHPLDPLTLEQQLLAPQRPDAPTRLP